ncbi:MAG TPA: PaaI family thioesterase [Caulobacteraceae bacterium]|jgi:acyl-coenzyme A thioesterase PaaI-like protein|nr:PaaI family thioesterase [Caulobacteraceae bacterium]
MADGDDSSAIWSGKPITEGEWAGWSAYSGDPFEDLAGPFYARKDESGEVVCAFRAERRHMNGGGSMHGGCLLTFADYSIFMIGRDALTGVGSVTASMNAEFIDGSREGELIECRGEVVRAGGSMVFLRGLITTGGRPLLNFSAIIKKVRQRA